MCGIATSKKSPKNRPFNVENATVLILIYVLVILSIAALNNVNTFNERTNILFHCLSQSFCGIIYGMVVWKTSEIVEFINDLDATINQRE